MAGERHRGQRGHKHAAVQILGHSCSKVGGLELVPESSWERRAPGRHLKNEREADSRRSFGRGFLPARKKGQLPKGAVALWTAGRHAALPDAHIVLAFPLAPSVVFGQMLVGAALLSWAPILEGAFSPCMGRPACVLRLLPQRL